MSFLSELFSFIRLFWGTPDKEKSIVFYAEHEGYYSYFEGVINELTLKDQLPIVYITSDQKDPVLKASHSKIRPFYFKGLLFLVMLFIKCKVFVMTLTELNQYHLKRSIYPVHYVYIFHSMVSIHMSYRRGSFDYYDSILCVGPYQIKEFHRYEELYQVSKRQLVEAGYYRLERVYNHYREFQKIATGQQDKLTVLIAPSWGKNNVIESFGEPLIEMLLQKEYRVIVRPHPETIRRFPVMIHGLEKKFCDQPDFSLEKSVATDESLVKADVLICDCSGVALEYAFGTERPVLFLDVPPKIQNPDYKKLGIEPVELKLRSVIGMIVSADQMDAVVSAIDELIRRRKDYTGRIVQLRDEMIFSFGSSSSIGGRHIKNLAIAGT